VLVPYRGEMGLCALRGRKVLERERQSNRLAVYSEIDTKEPTTGWTDERNIVLVCKTEVVRPL
jgi:hypothetical protein